MTEKVTPTLFADNVRYLMDRSGLSIRRLADAVQLNPSSIARILSSGTVPRKKTVEAVAGYFRVTPDAILNGSLREETNEALGQKGFFDKDYLASLLPNGDILTPRPAYIPVLNMDEVVQFFARRDLADKNEPDYEYRLWPGNENEGEAVVCAVRIESDEMSPLIRAGDLVFFTNVNVSSGSVVLAESKGSALLGRLSKGPTKSWITYDNKEVGGPDRIEVNAVYCRAVLEVREL